jgi:GntR family transcriptional regulator / MocR family aminotransferase
LRLGWIAAPARLIPALAREKLFDDMGSSLVDQLTFARFLDGGDFARHLRRVRPIYRRRRDATITALTEFLPNAVWSGAAGGLHLYLALPHEIDVHALAVAALRRGVLIEAAAQHWAEPSRAAPALVLGYGSLPEPATANAIASLADAITAVTGRAPARGRHGTSPPGAPGL